MRIRQALAALHPGGSPVLAAVSGGPDSMLLTWALHQCGLLGGIAHVNYQLRGADSGADEALVRAWAQQHGVPVFVHRADPAQCPAGDSLQAWARGERYAFFDRLLEAEGYAACATGHHLDDRIETLLRSLLQGDPYRGMQDIPAQRGRYLRPLHGLSRQEVLDAAASAAVPFRQDLSNDTPAYQRNRIRLELIPVLETLFPGFRTQLPEAQRWASLRGAFAEAQLEPFLDAGLRESPGLRELDWRVFEAQHGAGLLPLLVQAAVRRWGLHGHEAARAADLAAAQAGRQVQTRAGLIVRGRHGLLCYAEAPQAAAVLPVEIAPAALPLRLEHSAWTLELSRAEAPARFGGPDLYLSEQAVEWPLVLRSPLPGDRFRPFGMRGFKLVSDFLTDLKATPADKAACLVLASGTRIAALPGLRIDDRFRLADPERPALLLRFTRK